MLPKDVQEKLKAAAAIKDDKARIREIDRITDAAKDRHPECFIDETGEPDE